MSEKLKFVLGREENILEIGENAIYRHFLLFPQGFQKISSSRVCGRAIKTSMYSRLVSGNRHWVSSASVRERTPKGILKGTVDCFILCY